ncbi:MAG: outer membrane lipid asymmetry maintenance protein MlaD [candidate division NC10 bacterium RBG_16_65_8]|nr:MAG: outer membrane lipid asymmetry maintenance protein MlaD [candidate division NC10 bacterium RBG_16_65_8]
MTTGRLEIAVGLFVLVGLACVAYLTVRLGNVDLFGVSGYTVRAEFDSVSGLSDGAPVEIAGVSVGRVEQIALDRYRAVVTLRLQPGVRLQEDAIVSVKTKGLLGEKYVQILPGGSDRIVPPGGRLRETESPTDLQDLIAKYVFGKV